MDAVAAFEQIYATDLEYVPGCWKLCGDAHCCSFARYKAKFKLIAATPFQELPLLPGEFEFLKNKGWLQQFGDYAHNVVDYSFGPHSMRVESIVSKRPGCACDHATRPTICRLYPYFPNFDIDGRLIGIEPVGIYEILEELEGMAPACQITAVPPSEVNKLLEMAATIAQHPRWLYYIAAYRMTKLHVRERLLELRGGAATSFFTVFERALLRSRLLHHERLQSSLQELANQFEARYPGRFTLP